MSLFGRSKSSKDEKHNAIDPKPIKHVDHSGIVGDYCSKFASSELIQQFESPFNFHDDNFPTSTMQSVSTLEREPMKQPDVEPDMDKFYDKLDTYFGCVDADLERAKKLISENDEQIKKQDELIEQRKVKVNKINDFVRSLQNTSFDRPYAVFNEQVHNSDKFLGESRSLGETTNKDRVNLCDNADRSTYKNKVDKMCDDLDNSIKYYEMKKNVK